MSSIPSDGVWSRLRALSLLVRSFLVHGATRGTGCFLESAGTMVIWRRFVPVQTQLSAPGGLWARRYVI